MKVNLRLLILLSVGAGTQKFEYIYNKYKNLAYSLAFEILKDPALSEDAVSETFIRVYKNMSKIEDENSPKTAGFIAVIAKNCAKTAAGKRLNISEIPEPADNYNLEQSAIDRITVSEIAKAASALNGDLKAVFLLKYAYDMSNKEISKVLGLTPSNVGVLAHRAKKKILRIAAHLNDND